MVWQLLICITDLVCVVQGLIRLSDIIRFGHSNPVNNNYNIASFLISCNAHVCHMLVNGLPTWQIHGLYMHAIYIQEA